LLFLSLVEREKKVRVFTNPLKAKWKLQDAKVKMQDPEFLFWLISPRPFAFLNLHSAFYIKPKC
jgi:hypothetical protein